MLDWLTCHMPVMHHEPDRLLPIQFARLSGNQPVSILLESTPGLMSVEIAGATELETTQLEPNGTVTLALMSIASTPFMAA